MSATDAAQILHVGDDPGNDYAGAKAAGMAAVLFDPRDHYVDRAVARIRGLDEVTNFLEGI